MTRISFMRQQDIRVLCDKVKVMTEQIKKKQEAMWRVKVNMDGEKQSKCLTFYLNERMGGSVKGKECVKGGIDGGSETADEFIGGSLVIFL